MNKIKLLAISDDIRMPSGVGIQLNKLLLGLQATGKYDIVEIAGSLRQVDRKPVEWQGIKLYPTPDGYGNPDIVRYVMSVEKPDLVLAFSDPRFFIYLFTMDNEIRGRSKLLFYHTWDNEPFPKYNLPWYTACDEVVTLSKFSHELLLQAGTINTFIPHGMDPTEYRPLDAEVVAQERANIIRSTGRTDIRFIIFWNNRNITRKRPGDVVMIFKKFCETHPDSMLLMNTVGVDREGTDILQLINDLGPFNSPIVFNFERVPAERLNIFYNASDVTLNIPYNEGFGLCVAESLCAGTPVIATSTGGITDQMTDGEQVFGALLKPAVQEMFGVPGMPYIYRDFNSYDQVLEALDIAYVRQKNNEYKSVLGPLGREHITKNFHIDTTIRLWDELLQRTYTTPSHYRPWKLSVY